MEVVKAWNALLGRSENVRASVNALYTIEVLHAMVHEGRMYSHEDIHRSVANGDSVIHHVTPNSGSYFHVQLFSANVTGAPVELGLFEGSSYDTSSAGAAIVPVNHNRNSSNTFGGVMRQGCVLVNTGTALPPQTIIPGAKQSGGPGTGQAFEVILQPNVGYAFGFLNVSGGTIDVDLTITGYFPDRR